MIYLTFRISPSSFKQVNEGRLFRMDENSVVSVVAMHHGIIFQLFT